MKLLLSVMLQLLLLFAVAQTKKPQKTKAPVLEHTLLWEISGNGLSTASYLFGTMHLLCEQDAKLSDSLRFCIEKASAIYFEIDMDNMAEMMGMLRYIRMNNEVKLSDLLTESEYKKVKDYFTAHPSLVPFSMMERFKPFFISAFMQQQQMPCEKQDGMEMVIMNVAKKKKKEIKGLETIKFQASVFDSIPYTLQAKELVKMVDSAAVESKTAANLVKVYREQDLTKMLALSSEEVSGLGNSMDYLLNDRNARWITGIDTLSRKGAMLFAVGAAHLPGTKGVIQLLRNKGFKVRPMLHEVHSGELARRDD